MSPVSSPERIALVVSEFPRYVDAYFLREIAELARRGIRFRIFSLRTFRGTVVHTAARPFLADTEYVPFLFSRRLLRAQAWALRRRPGRYLGALATVIAGCLGKPRALVRALAVFPKSVYFARVLADEGIRHVHANWASHPATSALVMARLADVSWSFGAHASDLYLDGSMLALKIAEARFVVTCTRENGRHLAAVGGAAAAGKVFVSYHGVDLDRFVPPARPRPAGPFHVLAVGTLRDCKGLPDLIEAVGILRGQGLPVSCTIVGDGEERAGLERLSRRLHVDSWVRITGYLSQEALIPLYQGADVVALPARPESHFGIPNVLLEALAVGTPVVCTRLPSLVELMEDGEHGLYVPERDPAALAEALRALASDPARRRAMGESGRRKVEALFDARRNATTLEALFRPAGAAPRPTSQAAELAAAPSPTGAGS
jgi:glycosyltransferase involved in cell wall biosynthesis